MRHLVRTEIGLGLTFAAAMLVAYIGLAISISGQVTWVGVLILIAGLWSMVSALVVHDRLHRDAGEEGHALWGRHERWKPTWFRLF